MNVLITVFSGTSARKRIRRATPNPHTTAILISTTLCCFPSKVLMKSLRPLGRLLCTAGLSSPAAVSPSSSSSCFGCLDLLLAGISVYTTLRYKVKGHMKVRVIKNAPKGKSLLCL